MTPTVKFCVYVFCLLTQIQNGGGGGIRERCSTVEERAGGGDYISSGVLEVDRVQKSKINLLSLLLNFFGRSAQLD